jgi:CubicO group peptidase (beta-lactamase class C family)
MSTAALHLIRISLLCFACTSFAVMPVVAQSVSGGFPKESPAMHGMSAERLSRLTTGFARALDERGTPGATALILRDGAIVYEQVFGYQDKITKTPMELDAIFRIYSMTKPIVSVAVMMLWEEGRFKLNDPLHLYIPEFKNVRVAVVNEDDSEILHTVHPKRAITIQDLLRHTSGIIYEGGKPTAVGAAYDNSELMNEQLSLKEFVAVLSTLPLIAHPGERWVYGYSVDVLGRFIEVVSGMSLGEFLATRIFQPLNMPDTGFYIPQDKLSRAAQGYDPKTGAHPDWLLDVSQPPIMESGGGGLMSTLYDYARFSQMMLNGGILNGVRLLSPKTVTLMTANHLTNNVDYSPGNGFGLGFSVRLETGVIPTAGSKGEYRWGGWAGTTFWIDPAERLIGIMMIQHVASGYVKDRFKTLVYQAVIE